MTLEVLAEGLFRVSPAFDAASDSPESLLDKSKLFEADAQSAEVV
jgi:hypothetical protein